jgi:hypothetical protein
MEGETILAILFSPRDTSKDKPFWLIHDQSNSLVLGYDNEADAKESVDERNARAKKWKSKATYSVVPKP